MHPSSQPVRSGAALPAAVLAILRLVLAAMAFGWSTLAAAAPVVLDDARDEADAWSAMTVLSDPDHRLDAAAALAARDRFAPPALARGTTGKYERVLWLRIPVQVPAGANGQWVLALNYALLGRVDTWIVTDGRPGGHQAAGNRLPPPEPHMGARVPAFVLTLPQGEHTLLLRVEARGPIILPVRLEKAAHFHRTELLEQMIQGLLAGLAFCLLVYSLSHWVTLRDNTFGKFALATFGLALYGVDFFGIGQQYLWPGNRWMIEHAGGITAMIASCGSYLFVEQVLARRGMDRRFSLLMKGCAMLMALTAVTYALDILPMNGLLLVVSTLGAAPKLFGLPGAWRLMRRGDPVGWYFTFSWIISFTGAVVLGQVFAGQLEAAFWTMHALQLASAVDMLVYMRILGLRTQGMQTAMLRAEAAARLKAQFMANMSHEIRTPMNAILGMSRLALMAGPDARLRNYLVKILGAGEHLLGIINDILDFSKIEAGKMTLERVPFSVQALLDNLASLAAPAQEGAYEATHEGTNKGRAVALLFRVGPGVPPALVGDPLRLGQVLLNLTGNALKFTERGEVVVAVEVDGPAAGDGSAGVALRFSISDTGIGMGEDELASLFHAFSQGDASMTRRYGGTGLGLTISQQLVQLMGGRITVHSRPGVGSTFMFTIHAGVADAGAALLRPDAAARGGPAAVPSQAGLARLAGARVLLVDDNANNREVALDFMAAAPLRVDAATSGLDALRMVQAHDYDLVLMDIQMHGMDGLTAARRIRTLPGRVGLPIVAMTAHALAGDLEKSLAAGMNGHLVKPIDPELLFAALLRWIDPARLAGRAAPPLPAVVPAPWEASQAGTREAMQQPTQEAAQLPVLPGVDWHAALAGVDGQRARLQKRLDGFVREYGAAPAALRAALAAGDRDTVATLAHNLKSSAAYIGATDLSRVAGSVEHGLRAGPDAGIHANDSGGLAVLVAELAGVLQALLVGLAPLAAAPAVARAGGTDVRALLRELAACLHADDARAEDLLRELQALPAVAGHGALLAGIGRAVADIEYHAAIQPLGRLAHALDTTLEDPA
ncbi:hybrid sensor histidine kinase/response regulator [Pseudoduganella albidiflava]|uniref:Virulence sensor protein BvgS n=1 Tax=Pseudoduganella albidiflava TaxID=321983 RepID=A0A411WVU9_9BURK|nr:hybrid sensor histidine kinase/response regulator [Pseudoduganella albidiflava]QBI00921.1 hybrid sensor histidine kinase/response regulator [Pseudoduganella albidiflava]GGY60674.1 hypothetical protein GCM10007387_49090 [Pseudoduganella albidiflava]